MANPTKDKDLSLWHAWNKSRQPHDMQALLDQMHPIIMREVNKWAAGASRSLLEAEGKRLAAEAFASYNPNAGVALSTYLTTRLQKMSRIVYSTQSVARLPEEKVLKFNTYLNAQGHLRDIHGREPSSAELADHLGWSQKKLTAFQREAHRHENIASEPHLAKADEEDFLTDYVYHDLPPIQQRVFEYRTGYLGAPQLQGKEIMARLKLTQPQLSGHVKHIENAILRAQGTLGK